jgi:hypothetical protein
MIVPAAIVQQAQIESQVRAAETALRHDVVRINYQTAEDWSGQWAIFFRVVLSDDATEPHRDCPAALLLHHYLLQL